MSNGAGDFGIGPEGPDSGDRDAESGKWPRWLILVRNALAAGLGSFILTLPAKFGLVPESAIVRLFAIVTFVAALIYAARWEMHLEILLKYEPKGKLHILEVVMGGVLAALFLACGPACFFLLPDGTFQFCAAAALVVAIFSLELVRTWLIKTTSVKTGSEVADYCGLIAFLRNKVLEPADDVGFFRWLNERWEVKTMRGKVSILALWLCATMMTVASANGPRVAPIFYEEVLGIKPPVKLGSLALPQTQRRQEGGAGVRIGIASIDPVEDPEPDYYDLCGQALVPGEPAPAERRRQLYDLWLGEEEGLGAVFAGCAKPAHELDGDVWFAAGTCGEALRSLAVAGPGGEGLLLWRPARFALKKARAGSLLGVTSSQLTDAGEVYTVSAVEGTYVFLRDRLPAGEAEEEAPDYCSEVHEEDPPYVMLPPALSRLWSVQIETEQTWLWSVSEEPSSVGGTSYAFRSLDPADTREIAGYCSSYLECEMRIDGLIMESEGAGAIDIAATLEYAPPAV